MKNSKSYIAKLVNNKLHINNGNNKKTFRKKSVFKGAKNQSTKKNKLVKIAKKTTEEQNTAISDSDSTMKIIKSLNKTGGAPQQTNLDQMTDLDKEAAGAAEDSSKASEAVSGFFDKVQLETERQAAEKGSRGQLWRR